MSANEDNRYMGGVTDRLMPVTTVFQQDLDDNAELTVQQVLVRAGITDDTIDKVREEVKRFMRPITSDADLKELQPVLTKLVKMRTTIKHVCEKGREEANMVRNAYIKVQKQYTSYVAQIEDPLVKYKDEWKQAQERAKREEEEEAERQRQFRYAELEKIGCVRRAASGTDPERYVIGDAVILLDLIDTADAPTWDNLVRQTRMIADEQREKAEAEEAAKRAEQQRLEAERKALEEREAKLKAMLLSARTAELKAMGLAEEAGGYLSILSHAPTPTVLFRVTKQELEQWDDDQYEVAKRTAEEIIDNRVREAEKAQKEMARQHLIRTRVKTLMEAGWAQGKEDMQLYGTDNNDVPVQVCPIDMLADYDDAEIAVLVKAGNEQREKRKAAEEELLALKKEAEEREALNEKHKGILLKCGYELNPTINAMVLTGQDGATINQALVAELWTLDTVRLTQLVTDGNCELDRRKQDEEERIRQQERERLEAERVAAEKREAERVAALGDVDRWNEWVAAIKASAPAMTSAIGKQAVDRATKYLNDLSPGVIRDLKQD